MKKLFFALSVVFLMLVVGARSAIAITPVNKNASPEAKMLLDYISSQFGKKIISAQHGGQTQYDYVHTTTGKYPAIWGTDFINEARNATIVPSIKTWWAKGVIPTIMWHWGSPTNGEGYNSSKMTIDVNKCFVTGSAENVAMVADLKRIADHLTVLRDAKIPILWRPLHESSGGWFWWDKSGGPAFVKLWRYMYNYFTVDRGLNNLIWVQGFDGSPSAAYYVGDDYVDIIGADAYSGGTASHLSMYDACKNICNTKPITFHECGTPIDPSLCQKDNFMWSWFMIWDTYVAKVDKTVLTTIYNNPLTITLDKLPKWSTTVVSYNKPTPVREPALMQNALPRDAALYSIDGRRVAFTGIQDLKQMRKKIGSGVYFVNTKQGKNAIIVTAP